MTDQEPNTLLNLCTQSARLTMPLDETALWLICKDTLQGHLPKEPEIEICVADLRLRGYCKHNGLHWGMMFNTERKRLELVMLG